jgi:hypothetical protein
LNRNIVIAIIIIAIAVPAIWVYVNTQTEDLPSDLEKDENLPLNVEEIGGKYNTIIEYFEDHNELEYEDETGIHSGGFLKEKMRTGLDWIKQNTPEDSIFLCWWDYGHMIKGYTERNVIIRNPSEEIKESVMDQSSITEFDPHEKITDVAKVFTATDFTEISNIIDKYGVTHILVSSDDLMKVGWIFKSAGLEPTEYAVFHDTGPEFTEMGSKTFIAKLLENKDTGLELIFEDEEMKIYQVT